MSPEQNRSCEKRKPTFHSDMIGLCHCTGKAALNECVTIICFNHSQRADVEGKFYYITADGENNSEICKRAWLQ